MSATPAAEILAVGMATPLGLDGPTTAAAVRAGLSRFEESAYQNRRGEPQVLSLVRGEYLAPLHPTVRVEAGSRTARMLQLGAYALSHAAAACPEPPPLLLAVPEPRDGVPDPVGPTFAFDLACQAEAEVAERRSRLYRHGGAGAMVALRDALELLAAGLELVIVGGVDSGWDVRLLDALDAEGRLVGGSMDGFVPGEGAGFLLLGSRGTRRRLGLESIATVAGVALGEEPGHRYSEAPCRGDGLSGVVRDVLAATSLPPVRTIYAGMNGESLGAKEWSIAFLRNAAGFAEEHVLEHPADCIGDAGAAMAPILVGLAALGLQRRHRPAPCLVWCGSDREMRGAALLAEAS